MGDADVAPRTDTSNPLELRNVTGQYREQNYMIERKGSDPANSENQESQGSRRVIQTQRKELAQPLI